MPLTKTGYYADFVVYPLLAVVLSWEGLRHAPSNNGWEWLFACATGVIVWTLLEYLLHRHVLHRLPPFQHLHDLHHARSTDLIGTPTWLSLCVFAGFALILWYGIEAVLASGLTVGLMLGYLWYVAVHHVKAQRGSWLQTFDITSRPRLMQPTMPSRPTSASTLATAPKKTLVLFNFDWDIIGFERANQGPSGTESYHFSTVGFDLFSFPSNANMARFNIERFVARLARQAKARGWTAVVSNHEPFGALAAAMLAEQMGWPGTPVTAVLACQHKLHARQVLARVCPQANIEFSVLDTQYGAPVPSGLTYPLFVKPVKAAFSVLARVVNSQEELHAHTRFSGWELWVIRHLVEPFEQVFQKRLGPAQSAHRMMVEQPIQAAQFNLDGYVWQGKAAAFGVVDAIMYPGTQAFMRWDLPSCLAVDIQQRALEIAQAFLSDINFDFGMFNMEFFYDHATDRVTVIEFNPRMASQFSDLYLRVMGVDLHACALAMAHGQHPDTTLRVVPTAGAAASLVYRIFSPDDACPMPVARQVRRFNAEFSDGLLFPFPKDKGSIARDFKWLGSYRYGIVHLSGRDAADLKTRADAASAVLGWPSPYISHQIINLPEPIL